MDKVTKQKKFVLERNTLIGGGWMTFKPIAYFETRKEALRKLPIICLMTHRVRELKRDKVIVVVGGLFR